MRTLAFGLLLLAGLGAGCDDVIGPNDVAGTYVLRSVDGEALPTVLYADEGVTVHVLADTIRLNSDGTGSNSSVRNYLFAIGDASGPHHMEIDLTFELSDGRINIHWTCDIAWDQAAPTSLCAEGPQLIARPVPNGITVIEYPMGSRGPLEYEVVIP